MAFLSTLATILLHPRAFLDNLWRTLNIMRKQYQTFPITRKRDGLEVLMRRPLDPEGPFFPLLPLLAYPGFNPHTEVLPKGHKRKPFNMPLPCDILFEQDVAVPMSDGVKLYCDIFRPAAASGDHATNEVSATERVPIIMVWAPYGKHGNSELFMNELPERLGITKDMYSGYETFEGPDPAFWVPEGYAVVHVDARGSWNSEGNMYYWGNNDVFDGYDTVEYLAKLPWCNGKVGMAGNSWLAISQWFIASSKPPSLAAIAPWEGMSDAYRDEGRRGGIPHPVMSHSVGMLVPGRGLQEDQALMSQKNEFWNSYWEDKRAKLGRITCPAYVVASYSSKLHIQGTFRGWREIASTEKWQGFPKSEIQNFANLVRLRVHNVQEWRDWPFYQKDLALFFDFFLKGMKNDWPSTPPVRLSLLRFNPKLEDVINRPFPTYPPPSMELKTYFLDNKTKTGASTAVAKESQASYLASNSTAELHFDITFDKYTELAGYPKLRLWMECDKHDDMDVFVLIGRVDKNGKTLRHVNYPATLKHEKLPLMNVVQLQGPTGYLRASHREWAVEGPSYSEEIPLATKIDEATVSEGKIWDGRKEFWHPHLKSEKLSKGEVVKLEFTTWPIGMIFEKGEIMRLRISGKDMCLIEAEQLPIEPNLNVGMHILHTGGRFDSHLMLPVLGPSIVDGE